MIVHGIVSSTVKLGSMERKQSKHWKVRYSDALLATVKGYGTGTNIRIAEAKESKCTCRSERDIQLQL
jgi:hypothetical protein